MLMSFAALLICIAELIYTCQKQKVKWSWIITLPWLYHSRNFKDFIGPVARQHADSSIKVSFRPIVFASGLWSIMVRVIFNFLP
ncbi:hypothetical protein CICLE_v10023284mg [Citrus x clementina]|uniref:Uncharacterized protein n=1 Tax=Citrus clementina TaxID=85681 RepID=V4TNJ6_CITCL|nr:hypothetical protein CICLE_v10023284mg [Citrus x clementina]